MDISEEALQELELAARNGEALPVFNLAVCRVRKGDFSHALLLLADILFPRLLTMTGNADEESDGLKNLAVRICFLYIEVLSREANTKNIFSVEENNEYLHKTSAIFSFLQRFKEFIEPQSLTRHLVEFRIYLYKCRVFIPQRNMRGCRREIKNAMELFQKELRPYIDGSKSTDLLIKEKSSKLIASDGSVSYLEAQNQLAINLKANLEYLKLNYRKAIKLVSSSHMKDSELYVGHNNIACLYFKLGKHPASALFFHEALQLFNSKQAIDAKSHSLKSIYHQDILYNYAIALIHINQHSEALKVFRVLSNAIDSNFMIWIRMAECCIAIYDSGGNSNKWSNFHTVGAGHTRRVEMPSRNLTGEDSAYLREAVAYIARALCLIRRRRDSASTSGFTELRVEKIEANTDHSQSPRMPTEMDSEGRELVTLSELEDTALVLSAYAGLCLGDPAAALTRARTVLLREDGSARLRFLARCYASEAELALGQVDVDLSFYLAHDGSMLSQTSKLVNYGAMQVAQADLTGALATYLQAYSISPNDTNVIKGVAYVYLRLGKIKEALLIANYNQPITPIT